MMAGFPASVSVNPCTGVPLNGPDTGAAFPGINPRVGENEMLFPVGRSVYTGLQMKLVQRVNNLFAGVKQANFQVSYALSRFNSMTGDQDFVNSTFDFRDPAHYFGPSSLDRTHQLSFGGSFELPHGPRLSLRVPLLLAPWQTIWRQVSSSVLVRASLADYLGDGAAAATYFAGTATRLVGTRHQGEQHQLND